MKGSGIITKVRISEEDIDETIEELADPDLKLILHIPFAENKNKREINYKRAYEKLSAVYR
jgi:hypothetical protein